MVLAGSVVAGNTDIGYAIVTPELIEYRVGGRKINLPERIKGTENAATMNLIYHTTLAKLETDAVSGSA